MSAVDGGDGSVLHDDDQPAADSVPLDREGEDRSQESSSSTHEQGDCKGPERRTSNSTSGRWDSSTSWGEPSYHWGEDRHWRGQWRGDSWQNDKEWKWSSEDRWDDAWRGDLDNEGDDQGQDWDPWADAWSRKQDDGNWRGGEWHDRWRGDDRRQRGQPPRADGGDGRSRGVDPPDRQGDQKNVWDGWRHFAGSDRSDAGSMASTERRQSSGGSRPSEKITVPGFSGEDSEDVGSSARSYLRQVEAWKRMTLLPCHQQGLVLYQHLTGKAWVAAEELSVDRLAAEDGVQYLVKWITNRYLDLEVTRIGKAFSEFFRRLRRRPGQSIREYNSEYDRLHARLREVGCNLPEDCAAWLYVDRLQLEEAAELNLLASVGNTYSLPRLQQAAVIHDRGHRKPWEGSGGGKNRRPHTAHYTEADDSFGSGEEGNDFDDEDEAVPEEVAAAYATYQSAKQRYKENQKNRGYSGQGDRSDPPPVPRGDDKGGDKIKMMKAKSFCSGCGRRGHWHKDPECPHNQGAQHRTTDKGKPADVSFCNLLPAEVYAIKHESAGLVGITDTACARTVAGTQWLQAYTDKLAAIGTKPELRKECEAYRFGTGKIYYSSFFVVLAFELGNKTVHVRTSIINGDVPLLLSKTVLGKLGMVFDIEKGQADFNKVGLKGFDLLITASGHPAIPIVPTKMDGDSSTFLAEDLQLVPKGAYMAFAVAHGGPSKSPETYNFFYDKKLDPGAKGMLTQEKLPQDEFLAWWKASTVMSDFWVESEHAWIRVHVTPRKALFNPSTWKTRATIQREMLVQTAVEVRVTDGVCCTSGRWLQTVVDRWQHDKINEPVFDFFWVGRTWIGKRQAPSHPPCAASGHGTGPTQAGPINHMSKTQLLEEATRLGVIVHYSWSATEIKACIMEAREAAKDKDPSEQMKRISHMTLAELRTKASELKIDFGASTTKGNLLRLIRDSLSTPDQELMKIGKFKGLQFCEIPRSYGEWAVRELETADSPDPELVRFGRWFKHRRMETEAKAYSTNEMAAPYPSSTAATRRTNSPLSTSTAKDSWDMVAERSSTTSSRRRTRHEADDERKMEAEMDRRRDPRVGDKACAAEGSGSGLGKSVSDPAAPDREEDADRGAKTGTILSDAPRGRERVEASGNGGRKCCPELARDCYFTEEEFVEAYGNRHEVCEIDVGRGDHDQLDFEEDGDAYHDAIEDESEIEVFECKEFTLDDRIVFAYDSGDFSFATCKEILDEASGDLLKGSDHRKRVLDGARHQAIFGYYVHGGMSGVTKAVVNQTVFARYLNAFVKAHVGKEATWGAVGVFKGGSVKVHHDYNNAAGSSNYFTSFGQRSGGELWTHDPAIKECDLEGDKEGAVVWKRTGAGEWLPGTVTSTQEKFVEFNPHIKHHVAETDGEAWQVVAYTPRGLESIKNDTAKFLKNCGFPLPRRKRKADEASGKKPNKKQRGILTNTVGKLSILFTTLLAAANSFLCEAIQTEVINDPIVLLEIGGMDATLDATELDKAVLEPLSWEDYADQSLKERAFHLVKAVTPRQLHLHLGGAPDDALGDLKALVHEQLMGGGAVVLQGGEPHLVTDEVDFYQRYNENHEGEVWTVLAKPGAKNLEVPGSLSPHHVLVVSEGADDKNEKPLRIDGSGISFEEGVPGHVQSALRRLHQNLGHPRGVDLVRHLRLAGCEAAPNL